MQGRKNFSPKMRYQVDLDNLVPQNTVYQMFNFLKHNRAEYFFLDQKRKLKLVSRIQKQITKFALTNTDLGFVSI